MPERPTTSHSSPTWVTSSKVSACGVKRPSNVGSTTRKSGELWLVVGLSGIAFRVVQLFVLKDFRTGLVWATKIATDPFHDIKLYHRAPWELLTGRYTRHTAQSVAEPIIPEIDPVEEIVEEIPVPVSKPGV